MKGYKWNPINKKPPDRTKILIRRKYSSREMTELEIPYFLCNYCYSIGYVEDGYFYGDGDEGSISEKLELIQSYYEDWILLY